MILISCCFLLNQVPTCSFEKKRMYIWNSFVFFFFFFSHSLKLIRYRQIKKEGERERDRQKERKNVYIFQLYYDHVRNGKISSMNDNDLTQI